MWDYEFQPSKKNYIHDLNIVPVLDMLVAVIFFLLLSTSFIGYTKLQVPPSSISAMTESPPIPPLNPQLMIFEKDNQYVIQLSWKGTDPAAQISRIAIADFETQHKVMVLRIKSMMENFAKKFPQEKTIQIGLETMVPFQVLVDAMDAVREKTPDVVLISYEGLALEAL